MKRTFALAAACIAAFAFTVQAANAGSGRHVDKRVAAVALATGAATTVGILSLNHWKFDRWLYNGGLTRFAAWGVATVGCAAVSPMVATVVLKRPLSNREAGVLLGSCVVPIVGGWLVNEAYNAHPEWEPAAKKVRHSKKKAKKSKM